MAGSGEVYVVALLREHYTRKEHYPLKQAEGDRGEPQWFDTAAAARSWAQRYYVQESVEGEDWQVVRVLFSFEVSEP